MAVQELIRSPRITSDVEKVTPAMAAKWLEQEDPNRRLSHGTGDAYARLMTAGEWELNGEAIQFDNEGRLLNGQHRLHACVKSGVAFDVVVVRGLPTETQRTMDDPRRRSALDQQRLLASDTPSQAVAAARWLLKLRLASTGSAKRTTNTEVLGVLAKHPGLSDSARKVGERVLILAPSIATTFHYIGSELLKNPDRAEAMLKVLEEGVPDYPGCAMHAWREKLIRAQRHGGQGLSGVDQFDGTSHAWNLFVAHTPVKRFVVPDDVTIENLAVGML